VSNQPFTDFAEYAGHPHRIAHGQANESAKQQVVLGLLNQLSLRAHAVGNLQQYGLQQFLGRYAGATTLDVCFVHAAQQRIHLHQGRIDQLANRAQWEARWHEVVQMTHRENALGEGVSAAHHVSV
jgi:hypothetical protein